MKTLNVDLAAKFSAAAVMSPTGEVLHEFDSWGKSSFAFTDEVVKCARDFKVDAIVIEDVPYGLSKQFMVKPVLRLQGIFIYALGMHDLLDITVFVNPATWQRTFEGVFRGKAAGALAAANLLGYTPPDMLILHEAEIPAKGPERTKLRTQLKKASTDYVDSFLMGKWSVPFSSVAEMLELSGVQAVSI